MVVGQDGTLYVCTVAGTPGTWVNHGSGVWSGRNRSQIPTGALQETIPANLTNSNKSLASGTIVAQGIHLIAGLTISSISFASASQAAVAPTVQVFGLYDSALARLRVTADDTSTAWGSNTVKTLNLTSSFVTTYTGLHYLAILVVAGTPPNICSSESINGGAYNLAPSNAFVGNSGQTSLPATVTNGGGQAQGLYGYVS